jgi:benzylsuccinate CoA-transferase BbsF subunit
MGNKAFDGVKVADFSWMITGPLIAKYLGEHGAEVIRVESSIYVDGMRTGGPMKDGIPGINRSSYFANYNNNKYGVTLNLKHPKGKAIAKRIVTWADIVIDSFTPGSMERLGLGYDELKSIKPDVIMLRTCMQGQSGPHAMHPGTGSQLTALAGFVQLSGWPDRDPANPWYAYTDYIGPRFGLCALIAALDYRRRTGKGQMIDVSQYEAGVHFISPLLLDFVVNGRIANRMGNRCPSAAPHGVYRCSGEGRWCAIAIFTDDDWKAFCQAIGNPPWTRDSKFATLLDRKKNENELDYLVSKWTIDLEAEEVMVRLQSAGVAAGVVHDGKDVAEDPQLKHRHYRWELNHSEIGKHLYHGSGFKLSKTPAELNMPAPCLGEHNEYVYTKILGIPDEEFAELLTSGAFY